MRIGVDLTGGDHSPEVLCEAVLQAADKLGSSAVLVVFAQEEIIHCDGVEFHPVSQLIKMDDDPLLAIRRKKDSALAVGIRLLKEGKLDAFVSSGNTGALIASAALTLPALPGIHRPALLAMLPTAKDPVAVIDVGGNVSCKATHLVQFALMGAAYQRCFHSRRVPRVGLLNIGVESKKGTSELRQAYDILSQRPKGGHIHFVGNVEGRDVFQGDVDVLVTDGFTGNVFLKTSEGVSSFIFDHLKPAIDPAALPGLQRQFSYEEYPGAVVCGVEGVVIKCHGLSTAHGMLNGILGAANLVQNQFVDTLKKELSHE